MPEPAPIPPETEALRIIAAGSLTAVFGELLNASSTAARAIFGPSGTLRERIEQGEPADFFASADMGHPQRLAAGGRGRPAVRFARNRICVIGRETLGLTPGNLLDRLLDPTVKLATSTPGADPGGDYAWAVFARAEHVRPGARAILEAKAQVLVGGPGSLPLVAGRPARDGVFLSGRADVMLGYRSGAAGLLTAVPGLVAIDLPDELAVLPEFGFTVLTGDPRAAGFASYLLSAPGQTTLARFGFIPVTPSSHEAPTT